LRQEFTVEKELMLAKTFVILFMLVILYCLGSSLYFLVNDDTSSRRVVKALSWRIGLSVSLFILLFIGFLLGIITPHGL